MARLGVWDHCRGHLTIRSPGSTVDVRKCFFTTNTTRRPRAFAGQIQCRPAAHVALPPDHPEGYAAPIGGRGGWLGRTLNVTRCPPRVAARHGSAATLSLIRARAATSTHAATSRTPPRHAHRPDCRSPQRLRCAHRRRGGRPGSAPNGWRCDRAWPRGGASRIRRCPVAVSITLPLPTWLPVRSSRQC